MLTDQSLRTDRVRSSSRSRQYSALQRVIIHSDHSDRIQQVSKYISDVRVRTAVVSIFDPPCGGGGAYCVKSLWARLRERLIFSGPFVRATPALPNFFSCETANDLFAADEVSVSILHEEVGWSVHRQTANR